MKWPRTRRSNCSSATTRKSPRATRSQRHQVRQPDHLGSLQDRATDIHFEPAEDELRIATALTHPAPDAMPPQLKRYQAALISRVKVMSGMNIAEKRLPQDGRINVRIKGEEIDIRVQRFDGYGRAFRFVC